MKKGISAAAVALFALSLALSVLFVARERGRPYLTLYGHPAKGGGSTHQTVEILQMLKEAFPVRCEPIRRVRSTENVPRALRALIKPAALPSPVVLFEEPLWSPEDLSLFQDHISHFSDQQIRIACSQFPSTAIPQEWVFILNSFFDAVAVPNLFLADVYQQSGVKIPIFEIAPAMDLEPFLREPLREKPHSPLVFAHFGPCEERSNQLALIRAFAKAFGNSSDVLLKINTSHADCLLRQYLQWEVESLKLSNVQLTGLCFDEKTYLDFFKTVDCYVSLAKAEGFAYYPRQALALGIPVIATNNTAQSALCESPLVIPVASIRVQQATHAQLGNLPCGEFFNCDVEEAARAMRSVYEEFESYLAKAEKARDWVQQWHSTNCKELYRNLVKPQKVVLGDENRVTPDYLMTTSQALYDKYIAL